MNEKIKVNDSNIFVGIIMCECVIVTNYRHVGGFFIYIFKSVTQHTVRLLSNFNWQNVGKSLEGN